MNQFPTASDGDERCQWLHSLSLPLSVYVDGARERQRTRWLKSVFAFRSTFLLLFFKTQLRNLIIFCIVIESQMLNKAPRAPPARITSSFVVALRTNKGSTHEPSWISISCKWHLAHRAVACMWVWQVEGEVVPIRWVLFELHADYSVFTFDKGTARITPHCWV